MNNAYNDKKCAKAVRDFCLLLVQASDVVAQEATRCGAA